MCEIDGPHHRRCTEPGWHRWHRWIMCWALAKRPAPGSVFSRQQREKQCSKQLQTFFLTGTLVSTPAPDELLFRGLIQQGLGHRYRVLSCLPHMLTVG